jgi:hypothetical protein
VAIQRLGDLRAARLRIAVQQRLGADQDARKAVAALPGLQLDERRLQRMRPLRRSQPLDGGHRLARDSGGLDRAGMRGLALHQHRAGPALAQPAAESGPHQAKVAAQHVEQHGALAGIDLGRCAVQGELDRGGHRRPPQEGRQEIASVRNWQPSQATMA